MPEPENKIVEALLSTKPEYNVKLPFTVNVLATFTVKLPEDGADAVKLRLVAPDVTVTV